MLIFPGPIPIWEWRRIGKCKHHFLHHHRPPCMSCEEEKKGIVKKRPKWNNNVVVEHQRRAGHCVEPRTRQWDKVKRWGLFDVFVFSCRANSSAAFVPLFRRRTIRDLHLFFSDLAAMAIEGNARRCPPVDNAPSRLITFQ